MFFLILFWGHLLVCNKSNKQLKQVAKRNLHQKKHPRGMQKCKRPTANSTTVASRLAACFSSSIFLLCSASSSAFLPLRRLRRKPRRVSQKGHVQPKPGMFLKSGLSWDVGVCFYRLFLCVFLFMGFSLSVLDPRYCFRYVYRSYNMGFSFRVADLLHSSVFLFWRDSFIIFILLLGLWRAILVHLEKCCQLSGCKR